MRRNSLLPVLSLFLALGLLPAPALAQDMTKNPPAQDAAPAPSGTQSRDQPGAPAQDRNGAPQDDTSRSGDAQPASRDAPARRDAAPAHPAPAKAAAAAPAPAPEPAKPAAVSLTKDSLAGELIDELNVASDTVAAHVAGFVTLFSDLNFATRFAHATISAPGGREVLWDRAVHVLGLLALALALMLAPRPLLRRAMDRMQAAVEKADRLAALREARERPVEAAAPPPEPAPEADIPLRHDPDAEAPITDRITSPEATATVAEAEASDAERAALDAEGKAQTDRAEPDAAPLHAAGTQPGAHSGVQPGAHPAAADAISAEDRREAEAEAASRAEIAARRQQERARDALNRHRTLYVLRRVPVAALRLLIELVPVVLFALLFWAGLSLLDMQPVTQEVFSAVGMVAIVAWALLALLRCILSPRQPALRLLPSRDDFARRLYTWLRLLIIVAAVAAAMIQWAQAVHMPWRGVRAMARLIVLIEHLLIAGMIWNLRVPIAERLQPPRRLRDRPGGRMLALAARWWWVPAMFFDFALWLVWAAQIRNGYERIWRVFIYTVAILVAARLLAVALLGLLDRLLRLDAEHAEAHPRLEQRIQRYYPVLRRVVTWALILIAVVVTLQAWGIPAVTWLSGGIGQRMTSAILSMVIAVAIAIVAYEFVGILLERQVDRYVDTGQNVRAGRLRTLLPIIRSVLLVGLGLVVIFTILSEIGVNVAPLLAGASIIGVAIGFGSQKLVQDFITGIFLLLENAMQVGDTVTAGGLTGVVEYLSVRTLRLRAGDGSVHIIPFSSVSTVTNVNRGRGNAAVSFDVDPGADVDLAADILKSIALQMRTEEDFRDGMLSDLQYWGVNAVSGSAVNLAGQIVCTDGARWAVQREFNRRVLLAFRDRDIGLANASQSIRLLDMPEPVRHPDDPEVPDDRIADRPRHD